MGRVIRGAQVRPGAVAALVLVSGKRLKRTARAAVSWQSLSSGQQDC